MIKNTVRFFIIFLSVTTATLGMASDQSYDPPVSNLPQTVQDHLDLTYLLLNGDVSPNHLAPLTMNVTGAARFPAEIVTKTMRPAKAFDQLYVLGIANNGITKSTQCVALDTSDGIILWDALNGPQDGPDVIEPSMRELGLDPARLKYIVITHNHGDHVGCSKYLAEKYDARVYASEACWDIMHRPSDRGPGPNRIPPPPPARDMVITDGMTLTLGETTVTFYITPGHTPGTVSTLIPVTDYGEPHIVAFWGGTGAGRTVEALRTYEQSLFRFTKIGIDAHADSIISNHACVDGSDFKSLMVENRKKGDPNPWMVGQSTFLRYMGSWIEAIRANMANVIIQDSAAKQAPGGDRPARDGDRPARK